MLAGADLQPVDLLLLGWHQLTLTLLALLGSIDAGVGLVITADGLELEPLQLADAGRLVRGGMVTGELSVALRAAGPLRLEAAREVPWDVVEDVAWRLGVAGCLDARLQVPGEPVIPLVGATPLAALVITRREVTVCWADGCEPPWRRGDPPRGLEKALTGVTLVPAPRERSGMGPDETLSLGDVLDERRVLGRAVSFALLRPAQPPLGSRLAPLAPRPRAGR
ncbi:MAG: hypothetical protein JNJ54_34695 [Myxococcaceae bacterium]|nr:hypothetical protein [Myxococcaceae bacterium]